MKPLVFEGAVTEENRLAGTLPLLQGLLTENAPPTWHRSPPEVLAAAPRLAAACRAEIEALDVVGDAGPHALLIGLVVLTFTLGQLISNMATALIGGMLARRGIDPVPLLVPPRPASGPRMPVNC